MKPVVVSKVMPDIEKDHKGQEFPALNVSSDASKMVFVSDTIAACSHLLKDTAYMGTTPFAQAQVT